jgi:hypothetical protein
VGALEEQEVDHIASLSWRLRRVPIFESLALAQNDPDEAIAKAEARAEYAERAARVLANRDATHSRDDWIVVANTVRAWYPLPMDPYVTKSEQRLMKFIDDLLIQHQLKWPEIAARAAAEAEERLQRVADMIAGAGGVAASRAIAGGTITKMSTAEGHLGRELDRALRRLKDHQSQRGQPPPDPAPPPEQDESRNEATGPAPPTGPSQRND